MADLQDEFLAAKASPSHAERIAPRFRYAKIKPTNNCNSKCITCTYWESKHTGELTFDEVVAALGQLRGIGVEEVMFTGGEPTLRKDLPEMVAAAREAGFSQIGMTTNGLSLGGTRIDRLLEAGLTEAVLSFEGFGVHDEVRGVDGNTRKILAALDHFDELRASYPSFQLKLATTLMNRTVGEVPAVVELARKHSATLFLNLIDAGTYFFQGANRSLFALEDRAAFDRLMDDLTAIKRAEPTLIGNSVASLDYARRYFDDPKQAQIPCYLGYVGCEIDANGDVFSNCWGLPPVGNIRDTALSEILAGDAYARRLGAMFRKECGGCSCGYILNVALDPGTAAAGAVGYAGERQ